MINRNFFRQPIILVLLALTFWKGGIAQTTPQPTAPKVVVTSSQGNRVYMSVKAGTLQEAIDSLYARVAELGVTDWSTILENGNNPGVDVDFGGYDATNVEDITAMGTLTTDSLLLNKDARITGRLQVVDAVQVGDSLLVTGHVDIAGTLEVDGMISGQIDDLSNHDSDDLSEGAINLYFTNARAVSALSDTIAYLIGLIDALQSQISGTASFTCGTSTVTYNGHDYTTAGIGTQCWFAENLQTTQYNDGVTIPSGLNNTAWAGTAAGAVAVYDEGGSNQAANLADYGRLYNWNAVNTGQLCPSGWHVPTNAELLTLRDHLGGLNVAGTEMKSSASDVPSWNGTNSSGFSGLPGGYRSTDGSFIDAGSKGYWWSSSEFVIFGDYLRLDASTGTISGQLNKKNGYSVRCLQDAASSAALPTVVTSAASDVAETGATLNGSISDDGGDAITATGFRWGQAANLSDAQDLAASATSGSFTGSLTGLAAGTTYYFTAFATNGEGTTHGDTLSFTTTAAASAGFTTCGDDITYQGYDYATVQIDSQCWFADNLQSSNYNDGVTIPSGLDNTAWAGTTAGAAAVCEEGSSNEAANLADYGRLYNWHAVNTGKLCPSGWHVPADEEWTTLKDYAFNIGADFKSSPFDDPPWNGANSSGFSASPGGGRNPDGAFSAPGINGVFWSSSPDISNAWFRYFNPNDDVMGRGSATQQLGLSVRCLLD